MIKREESNQLEIAALSQTTYDSPFDFTDVSYQDSEWDNIPLILPRFLFSLQALSKSILAQLRTVDLRIHEARDFAS